jgi:excisionase family DNA binding protein
MAEFYTVREAAELLGVDPKTVLRWIDKGYLRAVKYPSGTHRIRAEEVEALLKKSRKYSGRMFTCVVVDNNEADLEATVATLKCVDLPVEAKAYTSAFDALLGMIARKPDVILMDADSDLVEGVSVSAKIRAREELSGIPLILMAEGDGTHEGVVADIVLAKPVSSGKLGEALTSVLNLTHRRRDVGAVA